MEYWECRQQLADRCACEGALCTARRSPAIPYRRTAFFGQKLPIPPSNFDAVAMADDTVLLLEESMHELRSSLVCTSLHSSIGGYGDPKPFAPTLDAAPWLSSPKGGGDDELILKIL